jgi:hypothetical protein
MTGLQPEDIEFISHEDITLREATTYAHGKTQRGMADTVDEQTQTIRKNLEKSLVPDTFATHFFQPYRIYDTRDNVYSTY